MTVQSRVDAEDFSPASSEAPVTISFSAARKAVTWLGRRWRARMLRLRTVALAGSAMSASRLGATPHCLSSTANNRGDLRLTAILHRIPLADSIGCLVLVEAVLCCFLNLRQPYNSCL